MLKALCQSLCLSLPLAANVHAASVVFLNPGSSSEVFWSSYSRFMQAAAQDLGMSLKVEYSERSPERTLSQARDILQGPKRPDYLVLVNEQYIAPRSSACRRAPGSSCFWSTTA